MMWHGFLLLALATLVASQIDDNPPDICWRDSYPRGAGTIPHHCLNGTELNGALCYPICEEGFHGVGPVCWEKCPDGWKNGGVFCYQGGKTHTKKSYGRTAGTIPVCAEDLEEQAGLCYHPCVNTEGMGPVCWAYGSGTFSYRTPCPNRLIAIAYASSAAECQKLERILEEGGIDTAECLYDFLQVITGQGLQPLLQCRQKVNDLIQQFSGFAKIKDCSKVTS